MAAVIKAARPASLRLSRPLFQMLYDASCNHRRAICYICSGLVYHRGWFPTAEGLKSERRCCRDLATSINVISDLFVDKQAIFQFIYNIPLLQGSERLNLLHRQARNLFLLTNSVLLGSKHFFKESKFRALQPTRLLHVRTKNAQIFIKSFKESKSFRLTQYSKMIVFTILKFTIKRLQLSHKNS